MKDKGCPFISYHLTSGFVSARIACSATAKSWKKQKTEIQKQEKEGGAPLSFADPSSDHRSE